MQIDPLSLRVVHQLNREDFWALLQLNCYGWFPFDRHWSRPPEVGFQHIRWRFSSKCLLVLQSPIGKREYQPHKHVKMKKISILWTKSELTRTKYGFKMVRSGFELFELKPTWNIFGQILVRKLLHLVSDLEWGWWWLLMWWLVRFEFFFWIWVLL